MKSLLIIVQKMLKDREHPVRRKVIGKHMASGEGDYLIPILERFVALELALCKAKETLKYYHRNGMSVQATKALDEIECILEGEK